MFQRKQWVQKPKRENQVGDLALVDKDPIPIRIQGKVGVGYFYILILDGELSVRGNRLTLFDEN